MLVPSQKCSWAKVWMLATWRGANCGASSMITRPAGRSMYSRLAGSGVRQSLAGEASKICCGLR